MAKIVKVLRMLNRGGWAVVYVQLEDGDEEYRVYVGGEVKTIEHNGVLKAYVLSPWRRPKQSRKTDA